MNYIKNKTVVITMCIALLQACGATHIQSGSISSDTGQFRLGQIGTIDIDSVEENSGAEEANTRLRAFATQEMTRLITVTHQLTSPSESSNTDTLAFNLDVDIVYGSRAARYWAGFGAGKGTVRSIFEVRDMETGEIKFRRSGASDLSVGAFGGSMENVIMENIRTLLNEYSAMKQES